MARCESLLSQMSDLGVMSGSVADRDENSMVLAMASVAELNRERCLSVHSLLFVYEQLSPGRDRDRAGEYISFRIEQYATLRSDIDFANKSIGQTKLPGVAREAQRLRDQLRTLSDSFRAFKPK